MGGKGHGLSSAASKARAGSRVVLCCLVLKERREEAGFSQARRGCDGGRLDWGAVAYGAGGRPPG